jgi:carbonic anhydrase
MKSFLNIAIVLLLILVSSIFAVDYNYDGGPESWNVNPNCRGYKQSPINFDTTTDSPSPSLSLSANDFRIYKTNDFSITNKGHTIEVTDFLQRNSITFDYTIYYLQQVHFHTPSEHHINGKHYDAEAHFVFKNQYNKLSVIGILYSVNAGGFSKFLDSIQSIYVSGYVFYVSRI